MKLSKFLPLLVVASLTACSSSLEKYTEETFYYFDSFVSMKSYNSNEHHNSSLLDQMERVLSHTDKVSDMYQKRDVTGVYDLNHTNEKIEIDRDFYRMLAIAKEAMEVAKYFNPFIGSLSNKWKESLANNQVLSNEVVQEELSKMNTSDLLLEEASGKYFAQRTGEAILDLGAIAKGYALDRCQDLLPAFVPSNDYLVNAGNSSILLGSNMEAREGAKKGEYVVKIKDLEQETYLHESTCIISTSGISEQETKIGDQAYSHIINPVTGSAISLYDAVIVISDFNGSIKTGLFGDALSTSFMMSTIEEIKEVEATNEIKVIVIKDNDVLYKSEGVELYS